jgi:FkbM family methyltransferase
MRLFRKAKQLIADLVQRHPYTYFYSKILVNRLPYFLPHEQSFFAFKHLAKENDGLFLDVGANDGISALSFRKVNQRYSIVSIEANPYHESSLARLSKRLKGFSYHLIGASDDYSEFDLYVPFYKRLPLHSASTLHAAFHRENFKRLFSNSLLKHISWRRTRITTVPLDSFGLKPSIIKIDVEGHEIQVLKGLQDTIAKYRPYLMVECSKESFPEVDLLLAKHDLVAASYSADRDAFRTVENDFVFDMGAVEHRNIFYVPREKLSQLPLENDR